MGGYYVEHLSAERLRRCYQLASPRVQRYLQAEIDFVRQRLHPGDRILELGCGYGRVLFALAESGARLVGIDVSLASVVLARSLAPAQAWPGLLVADALRTCFAGATFDRVLCVQNGICAFGVDPARLVREALRVVRPGGLVLFSTYAPGFWPHRLEWFEAQAGAGLLGEIDRDRTRDGTIVCRDGFRAGSLGPTELAGVFRAAGVEPTVLEVDGSSLFAVASRMPTA